MKEYSFNGNTIRAFQRSGKEYYMARDIMNAVGYSKKTRKWKNMPSAYMATAENLQPAVDRDGVEWMLRGSTKPEAQNFQRWLDHDQDTDLRRAEILKFVLAETWDAEQRMAVIDEILKLVTGRKSERAKLYTATELSEMMGTTPSMIGLLSRLFGLKTPEYGQMIRVRPKHGGKTYLKFVYNEKALMWFYQHREII